MRMREREGYLYRFEGWTRGTAGGGRNRKMSNEEGSRWRDGIGWGWGIARLEEEGVSGNRGVTWREGNEGKMLTCGNSKSR